MDLSNFLRVVRRHRWVVLATTVVTIAAVGAWASTRQATYTASTTLRLVPVTVFQTDLVRADDVSYLDRLTSTYLRLATSDSIRKQLQKAAGLPAKPIISASAVPSTELMNVSVSDTDPARAQRASNTLATILMKDIQGTENATAARVEADFSKGIQAAASQLARDRAKYGELKAQLRPGQSPTAEILSLQQVIALDSQNISTQESQFAQQKLLLEQRANALSIAEEASLPTKPDGASKVLLLVLATLAGVAAGVGLAFLLEHFDDRVYSTDEIVGTGIGQILGSIPNSSERGLRQSGSGGGDPMLRDAFQRLAIAVGAKSSGRFSTMLLTSAQPNEGKTTVAVNLARALAESGRSVLLIDADIRAPKIHDMFGLENSNGLTDIIERGLDVTDAVQASDVENLHILPSGPWSELPGVALGSPEMADLHAALSSVFDYVIYDTPALLSVSDALPLLALVDRVICVVRAAFSARHTLQMVQRQLQVMGVDKPELVINRINEFYEYPGYYQGLREVEKR